MSNQNIESPYKNLVRFMPPTEAKLDEICKMLGVGVDQIFIMASDSTKDVMVASLGFGPKSLVQLLTDAAEKIKREHP